MKEKSYVKCPKCSADAHKVHDPKEIEEKYKDDIMLQIRLKKQYICSNTPCSYQWEITMKELTKAFYKMREDEGKNMLETTKELKDAVKEV